MYSAAYQECQGERERAREKLTAGSIDILAEIVAPDRIPESPEAREAGGTKRPAQHVLERALASKRNAVASQDVPTKSELPSSARTTARTLHFSHCHPILGDRSNGSRHELRSRTAQASLSCVRLDAPTFWTTASHDLTSSICWTVADPTARVWSGMLWCGVVART